MDAGWSVSFDVAPSLRQTTPTGSHTRLRRVLASAHASLLADEPAHVLPFTGVRCDCGSKIGYLRATVEYGLRHPDLGDSFCAYLQNVWER